MTFSILSRLFYTVYTDMSFKENNIVYPKISYATFLYNNGLATYRY